MKNDLLAAIEAFNKSSQPPITLQVTRDGRTVAHLPRMGQDMLVKETSLTPTLKVTAKDIALLCEEARLAAAPGQLLLDAGLAALKAHAG